MQENTTPDNVSYLILGLVVVFGFLGAYIASMVARYRNLQKDTQVLEQLGENE